ncbi:MAG: TetR/AcrR family transcriptional regulator [Chloroflexi bacterium]|nr:TetR/AcrR family transcriptional regulator [Chloroflexota bacterium]
MSSQSVNLTEWTQVHQHILQFEQEELVTRTFRRLDPERQQAVITAILDEAIEKGPTALNIKQVAERAGVAIGSLYQYFGNREGLMNFTIELCVRYMADLFNSYRPFLTAMPLREGLTAYLTGGVEWSQTQSGLLQIFARAAYHGDAALADRVVKPIATTLRGIVHDMLLAAQQRGEIRSDIDLEATTRIIHALTIAVGDAELLPYLNNYFQVTDKKVSSQKILDALLALIVQGIGINRTT